MGIASLRRNRAKAPAQPSRPTAISYDEHVRIVQELTQKYERKILALGGNSADDAPEPQEAKPAKKPANKPKSKDK